ncbi:MAG: hypothetical protein KAJ17_06795 [Candidatus Krumholzibacteria bacterium]|nr:hypothetical protein [Candidatus Krumholzibacteria bacterium]MCK5619088.1 hypothetical protein [Candidatus Krumholzibacteria bacterium]
MNPRILFAFQVLSLLGIWVFVLGISAWIIRLIWIAHRLNDMPGASLAISVVAIPVFLTGASVLTYVFIGLRRGREKAE